MERPAITAWFRVAVVVCTYLAETKFSKPAERIQPVFLSSGLMSRKVFYVVVAWSGCIEAEWLSFENVPRKVRKESFTSER
jgi:hypothetical protein